jgi:pre-mRNA-splicing factor CWC26
MNKSRGEVDVEIAINHVVQFHKRQPCALLSRLASPCLHSDLKIPSPSNPSTTTSPTPTMSLSSYLASRYLTADPTSSSTSKKRKRKTKDAIESGLIIADDDATGWDSGPKDLDDDGPLIASGRSAEFRKAKKNAWKVVGELAPSNTQISNDGRVRVGQGDEDDAAERIIRQAAEENTAAMHTDDDPTIVKMGDGTHAGLQSASAVAAQMSRAKAAEMAAWAEEEKRHGHKRGKEETVYRDATGRRIDIAMRRAEARKEEEERRRKEKVAEEELMGDVQKREKERRREELEEARFMPLARTVDDEEINRELKEKLRWDDPALQFLEGERVAKGKGRDEGAAGGDVPPRKKVYQGAAQPNRYGIRPGHRWDGVDRGNGWEAERFKAQNRTKRNKDLNFAWQEDT